MFASRQLAEGHPVPNVVRSSHQQSIYSIEKQGYLYTCFEKIEDLEVIDPFQTHHAV